MIARDSRIRLGDLDEWLAGDGTFAEAALHILKQEKPLDTFTAATAGKALIQHWLEERQLKCYAHGQEIDYFTEVGKDGVFPDENGDYGLGLMAVEHDRIIDRDELVTLIHTWGLPMPANPVPKPGTGTRELICTLENEAPPAPKQANSEAQEGRAGTDRSALMARLKELTDTNCKNPTATVAKEFGISDSRVRTIKREERKKPRSGMGAMAQQLKHSKGHKIGK